MLFDKLMVEFEYHFKRRLLSVANGTFDGVYSHSFKGPNFKGYLCIYKNLNACFNFITAFTVFIMNDETA